MYSCSTDKRQNTFRNFKQNNFEFPSTYKEFRKMRTTSGPITVSQLYEKMAPLNPTGYKSMSGGKSPGVLYQKYAYQKQQANTWNPATGMKYGQWNNEFDGLPDEMADYPGCSTTAEPIDKNSYDQFFHLESTVLSRAYFSHKNIEFIRHSISGIFKEKYNLPLGLQPYKPTKLFMIQVFNDLSGDMCQTNLKHFDIMNAYTLEELEKRIYKNLNFQFGYQNWVQKALTTVQIENPMYTRIAKKDLSLSKYYNGCELQR
jgi:hypothetical protein